MAEALKLASAGDDIRLWNLPQLSLVSAVNPHTQSVGSICWNHNNQLLASAAGGDKVVLTYAANGIKASRTSVELAVGEGQTCVAFSSNSRYLLTGGKTKTLNVWDTKTRNLKKTYRDHTDAVTCCLFNSNDSCLASGSANGDVIIHNISTGQSCSPLRTSKTMCIRAIQYSYFKKSLLASVSDDGCLNMWDTNARKLIASYPEHKVPATGLAFSTINEVLLASVGLDKKIIFYDVQSKRSVKVMVTETPLTAVDFFYDGCTLAVGTTRGKIHLYDLRAGSTPLQTMEAHKSSVQCLTFQKQPTSSNSKASSKASSSTKTERAPKAPAPKPEKGEVLPAPSNQAPPKPVLMANGVRDDNDIFSPVRDSDTAVTNNHKKDRQIDAIRPNAEGEPAVKETNVSNNVSASVRHHPVGSASKQPMQDSQVNAVRTLPPTVPMSTNSDITSSKPPTRPVLIADTSTTSISPLAGESANVSRQYNGVPKANIMDRFGNDTTPRKEVNDSSSLQNMRHLNGHLSSPDSKVNGSAPAQEILPRDTEIQLPGQGISATSSAISHSSPVSYAGAKHRINQTPPVHVSSQPQSSQGACVSIPSPMNGPMPVTQSTVNDTAVNAVAGGSDVTSPHGLQPFQIQFIRSMINEELEELRVSTHRDIVNLHVEMIRQFQIQQNEMKKLFQTYSVNEALVEEIQRLREENHRLKTKF